MNPFLARRYFADEVVQSSAMDCGPATLKSLLGGFGIQVSYGRLREACQTDVDGTSIDTIEALANQLGLQAEQVMLPADFLDIPEAAALPAIAVFRQPHGDTHFVVLWRRHGPLVQIMDPASGRRWLTWQELRSQLYQHETEVPLTVWQEWVTSDGFRAVLRARLRRLGIAEQPLLDSALTSNGASAICTLEAALRAVEAMHRAGAIGKGRVAQRFLEARLQQAAQSDSALADEWYAMRKVPEEQGRPAQVRVRGAVLVRALGSRRNHPSEPLQPEAGTSPLMHAVLDERACRPVRDFFALLGSGRTARWGSLLVLLFGALLYCAGVTGEALLLRSLLDVGPQLGLWTQRMAFLAMTLLLAAAILLLGSTLHSRALRLGRLLETRLRVALLEKIPRLPDRFFHSRPISDMAERAHQLHLCREVPVFFLQMGTALGQLLTTTLALLWLEPGEALYTLLLLGAVLAVPLAFLPLLQERDLRARTHQGSLASFFLDALRGLIPLRAHCAEAAVRLEQEGRLVEWVGARDSLSRIVTLLVGVGPLLALVMLGLLWLRIGERPRAVGTVLLLLYFSLNLLLNGQRLALGARKYPLLRSMLLRLLEPLRGGTSAIRLLGAESFHRPASAGAAIRLIDVTLQLAGHPVLIDLKLELPSGSHVAIVGRSGAGKSSLLGLLLGFYEPASGLIEVDGRRLGPAEVAALRQQTAWLDPQVQIWNGSLLENLCYGSTSVPADLEPVLQAASLRTLLYRLPGGLSTPLGESGACISGGEGQRVRLGRALLRDTARLVLLDEPFRGLDHGQRAELLCRTRAAFAQATLLCVTHDVTDTQSFPRVLVIEDGRIVEDGVPGELRERPGSRYGALLAAEDRARRTVFQTMSWRRLRLEGGQLEELKEQE